MVSQRGRALWRALPDLLRAEHAAGATVLRPARADRPPAARMVPQGHPVAQAVSRY